MDTKLTLKLKKEVIDRAKEYAANNEISLSKIVENYLKTLTIEDRGNDLEISPFVRSLATGSKIPTKIDTKKEYSDHLLEKYR